MSNDRMIWDAAADHKLFLTVLSLHEIKVDNEGVAAAFGPPCNAQAIRNRIKRLKLMVKEQKDGRSLGSDSAPGNVTDTTPKKGGTEKAKAATKAKGRAKKAAAAKKSDEFVGGDSDGENGFSNDVTSDKKTVKGVKKGGVFNKRKSVAVKDDEDDDTHKKVKTEEEGSGDNNDILEFDPSSDQLVAELDASADK